MKTCQETAALLTDYLEEHLPQDDANALKVHIRDCPACEAFIRSFKIASDATKQVLMKQIPSDFNSRLHSFLKQRVTRG